MLHHFSSPPRYGLDLFLLPLLPFPNIAPPHLKADPLTPATSRSYGLDLFLLSIDEGISGYRDDSLETVKRNEAQYQVGSRVKVSFFRCCWIKVKRNEAQYQVGSACPASAVMVCLGVLLDRGSAGSRCCVIKVPGRSASRRSARWLHVLHVLLDQGAWAGLSLLGLPMLVRRRCWGGGGRHVDACSSSCQQPLAPDHTAPARLPASRTHQAQLPGLPSACPNRRPCCTCSHVLKTKGLSRAFAFRLAHKLTAAPSCLPHCTAPQIPLHVFSYKDLYGWTMDEIVAAVGTKSNCTFCGVFRRQVSTSCRGREVCPLGWRQAKYAAVAGARRCARWGDGRPGMQPSRAG